MWIIIPCLQVIGTKFIVSYTKKGSLGSYGVAHITINKSSDITRDLVKNKNIIRTLHLSFPSASIQNLALSSSTVDRHLHMELIPKCSMNKKERSCCDVMEVSQFFILPCIHTLAVVPSWVVCSSAPALGLSMGLWPIVYGQNNVPLLSLGL